MSALVTSPCIPCGEKGAEEETRKRTEEEGEKAEQGGVHESVYDRAQRGRVCRLCLEQQVPRERSCRKEPNFVVCCEKGG
jgi:hypothetical protein